MRGNVAERVRQIGGRDGMEGFGYDARGHLSRVVQPLA